MTKKKLIIIPIIVSLVLSFLLPIVNADNENNANVNPISIDSTNADTANNVSSSNVDNPIRKGDVYIAQNDITIDYIIDGNAFILGNNVTINSQIGGDVFVCAKNLTIGEHAYIFSNLFVSASNVNIKGVVYDLYSIANTVNIDGYIYRDIRSFSSDLNINGVIGRNAYVQCNKINFATANQDDQNSNNITRAGSIAGDLNYSSHQESPIPEKAVSGKTNFEQLSKTASKTISTYLVSLGSLLVIVLVIWGLCLLLAPKFLNNTINLVSGKKILPVLGCGILTPIALSVASVILLFINITSSISLLLLTVLVLLFAISTSITIIAINNLICSKLKISKNIGIFGILLLTTIILWAITLIPFVGTIISILSLIIGMGLITYTLFNKNKNLTKTDKKEQNKK